MLSAQTPIHLPNKLGSPLGVNSMAYSPLVTYSGSSVKVGLHFTTMKDLLTQMKTLMKADASFSRINTWKRGVLPPVPAFPVIAVLPVLETFPRIYAGGMYHVERTVNIETWAYSLDSNQAIESSMDWIEAVKEFVQANTRWDGQAIDTYMGTWSLGRQEQFKTGFAQSCVLPITVLSQEYYPPVTIETTQTEASPKELLNAITDTLMGYKTTTLAKVQRFYHGTVKGIPVLPAVGIVEETENMDHLWAGVESVNRAFQLFVFTKLVDKEGSLDWNLDLVEALKNILQANRNFGGKCIDSNIGSIEYGSMQVENSMLYDSTILLGCNSAEVL